MPFSVRVVARVGEVTAKHISDVIVLGCWREEGGERRRGENGGKLVGEEMGRWRRQRNGPAMPGGTSTSEGKEPRNSYQPKSSENVLKFSPLPPLPHTVRL